MPNPNTGRSIVCALLASAVLAAPVFRAHAFACPSPQAAPAAGQAPAATDAAVIKQEEDKRKALELLAKSKLETDPRGKVKLLAEAFKLDPTNAQIAQELGDAQRAVEEERKQQARRAQEVQTKEEKLQEARRLYQLAATGGGSGTLQQASTAVDAVLAMDKTDTRALQLRALIDGDLRTAWYRMLMLVSVLVAMGGGGLFALVKFRRKPVQLEVTEGLQQGESLVLQKKVTVIGTAGGQVDWLIEDPARKVSRRHCEISRKGRRYFVTDWSTNGTLVNGRAIARGVPTPLQPGDIFTLGEDVSIKFQ